MAIIKKISAKANSDSHAEALQIHKSMQLIYDNMTENYRYDYRRLKTAEQFTPYIEAINQITTIGLDSQNSGLISRANYFLNEMECEFVEAEDHEQKFFFAFRAAHSKIDEFINNLPSTGLNNFFKNNIAHSNKERAGFFNKDTANIVKRSDELKP